MYVNASMPVIFPAAITYLRIKAFMILKMAMGAINYEVEFI
jgi:hypothetical protein